VSKTPKSLRALPDVSSNLEDKKTRVPILSTPTRHLSFNLDAQFEFEHPLSIGFRRPSLLLARRDSESIKDFSSCKSFFEKILMR
jgi:hypothetical protein